MLKPGSILNNEFQIIDIIGQGGMGVVYLAFNLRLRSTWAIKEVDKLKFENNKQKLEEVRSEANLLARINHPTIPRVTDVIEKQNSRYLYIQQDYIDGKTLAEIIEDRARKQAHKGIKDPYTQRQFSLNSVKNIARQLINTFIYLHTRKPAVLYRDLKPGNIMMNTSQHVYLIDFGIAFEMTPENLAPGVKVGMGTAGYAAPEQYGQKPIHTLQTDIFNFGRVLYELVTGYCPAPNQTENGRIKHKELPLISELRPDIDEAMEEIIYTCMAEKLEDRYKSFQEVKYAFEHYDELGPSFRIKAKKQIKIISLLGATSLLLLSGSAGAFTYHYIQSNKQYNDMLAQVDVYNKVEDVVKLIEQNPTIVKPYNRLIELYETNDNFTVKEEQELLKLITKNLSDLKKQPDFPELAYNIGLLYIFYFKASDDVIKNKQLQMAQSTNWFKYAIDGHAKEAELAQIYYNIGNFNKDIVLAIKRGEDNGLYKDYFNNLSLLIDKTDQNKTPDLIKLQLVETIFFAVKDYRQDFINDGVSQEKVHDLIEAANNMLNEVQPKSEVNVQKKAVLLEVYNAQIKNL